MKVEVVVFATLRRFMPELKLGGSRLVEVKPGITMAELRDQLGLPADEVRVIMRNHLQAEPSDEVQEGDRVAFLPPVAGG